MKKVYQTKLTEKDKNGDIIVRGNCFRACLASLLEIDIDDIPPCENTNNADDFWNGFLDYLQTIGKDLKFHQPWIHPSGYSIISGESPRDSSLNHSCIAYDGIPIFDPHPDGGYVLSIIDYITIENI